VITKKIHISRDQNQLENNLTYCKSSTVFPASEKIAILKIEEYFPKLVLLQFSVVLRFDPPKMFLDAVRLFNQMLTIIFKIFYSFPDHLVLLVCFAARTAERFLAFRVALSGCIGLFDYCASIAVPIVRVGDAFSGQRYSAS